MIQIAVASSNDVKVNAVKFAFQSTCKSKFEVFPFQVDSGISNQPREYSQTYTGASNRLRHLEQLKPDADIFVSIESGLFKNGQRGFMDKAIILVQYKYDKDYEFIIHSIPRNVPNIYIPARETPDITWGDMLGEKIHITDPMDADYQLGSLYRGETLFNGLVSHFDKIEIQKVVNKDI